MDIYEFFLSLLSPRRHTERRELDTIKHSSRSALLKHIRDANGIFPYLNCKFRASVSAPNSKVFGHKKQQGDFGHAPISHFQNADKVEQKVRIELMSVSVKMNRLYC
jgi:hypothetical protein